MGRQISHTSANVKYAIDGASRSNTENEAIAKREGAQVTKPPTRTVSVMDSEQPDHQEGDDEKTDEVKDLSDLLAPQLQGSIGVFQPLRKWIKDIGVSRPLPWVPTVAIELTYILKKDNFEAWTRYSQCLTPDGHTLQFPPPDTHPGKDSNGRVSI